MKIFERFSKIMAIIGIILAITILLTPLFLFTGHPVCYGLVMLNSRIYLWQNYPELDVGLDKISYDFKHGGYYAYYSSPTSIDTHFWLVCDGWGNVVVDHADSIDGNTIARINQDYQNTYDSAIEAANFSFEVHVNFCNITHQYGNEVTSINKDFGITDDEVSKLEFDGEYDFREFAAKYGRITFYAEDPQVTVERAAEILLELKTYLDEQNIPFYAMEFKLRNPDDANDYVALVDILYTEITEDGLVERVIEYNDAIHAHYDKLDAAKRQYRP